MSTPNLDLYPPAYHSYVLAILNGKWDEYDPIGQPESFQAVKWLSETYPDLKRKMQFDALSLTMDSHPSEVSSARAVVNSHRVGWKAAKNGQDQKDDMGDLLDLGQGQGQVHHYQPAAAAAAHTGHGHSMPPGHEQKKPTRIINNTINNMSPPHSSGSETATENMFPSMSASASTNMDMNMKKKITSLRKKFLDAQNRWRCGLESAIDAEVQMTNIFTELACLRPSTSTTATTAMNAKAKAIVQSDSDGDSDDDDDESDSCLDYSCSGDDDDDDDDDDTDIGLGHRRQRHNLIFLGAGAGTGTGMTTAHAGGHAAASGHAASGQHELGHGQHLHGPIRGKNHRRRQKKKEKKAIFGLSGGAGGGGLL